MPIATALPHAGPIDSPSSVANRDLSATAPSMVTLGTSLPDATTRGIPGVRKEAESSATAESPEARALSKALQTPLMLKGANLTPPKDDIFDGLISPEMLKTLFSESVTEGGVDMRRVQEFVQQLTPQQKAVLENALKDPQAVGRALQRAASSNQN